MIPSSLETGKLRPLMVWRRQPGGTLWESMESDGAGLLRRHTGDTIGTDVAGLMVGGAVVLKNFYSRCCRSLMYRYIHWRANEPFSGLFNRDSQYMYTSKEK